MKYLVGVDEGTTGCKATIFDEDGKKISSSSKEYKSYYPNPGWVEQDLEEIKDSVFGCIKKAIYNAPIDANDIVGISHSNQGITLVLLDENENNVLDHTIGWQDLRYTTIMEETSKKVDNDAYYEISGMNFGTYNIPTLIWLQKNMPNAWKRVKRICSHQDYFLRQYGASGFFIDEGNTNFLSMADMKTNSWNKNLMDVYNIDESYLPEIIHTPGTIVGHVTKEVSDLTGLPEGCNVCLGGLDANCCAMAAGANKSGTQVLIMGTAGVSILATDNNELDNNKRITVRSNPGFGNWQYYIMTNTGASAFRWFRDEMCTMEVATSKLMNVDPYDLITKIASSSKPGANGVYALTCIQGSHTRIKNEKARGTFFGINLGTTKSDIAQAILEGICFEMRDILDMNEELANSKVKKIRLCGGVSKSPMWCQMFADIFGRPIELTEEKELGCLGAAMCAGIGAGLYKDCNDAVEKCVKIEKIFNPNEELSKLYNEIFEEWKKIYKITNEKIYIEK